MNLPNCRPGNKERGTRSIACSETAQKRHTELSHGQDPGNFLRSTGPGPVHDIQEGKKSYDLMKF